MPANTDAAQAGTTPLEEWPYLESDLLVQTRSRQVCMTCHWFRHHAGANCIPLLTCQLHQGLIAHGEHLVSRCPSWSAATAGRRRRPEGNRFSDDPSSRQWGA